MADKLLTTGAKVGPYTLLFRLGKGGMGEVWAASQGSQMEGFTRIVALKLLLDAELGSQSSLMFFDEARAASALQHAAIVPTLDLGRDGDIFYLAMEMVRGPVAHRFASASRSEEVSPEPGDCGARRRSHRERPRLRL